MRGICRIVTAVFALAWAAALALFAIGTLGLFGQVRDPLAGVFLVPLGLPWNRLADLLPEPLWPWAGALAPAVNLGLLWLLCRLAGRRGG